MNTIKGGTKTALGIIPHVIRFGMTVPVKVTNRVKGAKSSIPNRELWPPVIKDGKYIYALPGGGETP